MAESLPKNSPEPPKTETPPNDRDLPTLLLLLLLSIIVFVVVLFDPRSSVIGADVRESIREKAADAYFATESEVPKAVTKASDFFRYVSEYPGVLPRIPPESFRSESFPIPQNPSVSETPKDPALPSAPPHPDSPLTLRFGGYSLEISGTLPKEGITLSSGSGSITIVSEHSDLPVPAFSL